MGGNKIITDDSLPVPLWVVRKSIEEGNRHLLFWGGGGGGKTTNSLLFGLSVLITTKKLDIPYRILLISTTRESSYERLLEPLREIGMGFLKKEQGKWLTWKVGDKNCFVIGSLHNLLSTHSLRGTEFDGCILDELALVPENSYNEVDWRIRNRNSFLDTWILSTTNTYGPHAGWVYERWIANPENPSHKAWQISLDANPNKEFVKSYRPILEASPLRDFILEERWGPGESARFPWPLKEGKVVFRRYNITVGFDWGISDSSYAVWLLTNEKGISFIVKEKEWAGEWQTRTVDKVAKEVVEGTQEVIMTYNSWIRNDLPWWSITDGPKVTFSLDPSCKNKSPHGTSVYGVFAKEISNWSYRSALTVSTNDHSSTNLLIEKSLINGTLVSACEGGRLSKDLWGIQMGKPGKEENLVPHDLTHSVYALGYALDKVVVPNLIRYRHG